MRVGANDCREHAATLIRELACAEAAIGRPTGLVVMATGVRRGVAGVDLGNAADATLCDAGLPVVVVSPPEAAVTREPALRVATTAQPFD